MIKPTFNETKKLASSNFYKLIPISDEIYSDLITPIELFKILKEISAHCFILESMEDPKNRGRYTFLGFDPKLEITCLNGKIKINSEVVESVNPNDIIKKILESHRSAKFDYLPPFTGGLAGYFSYDYTKYSEPILMPDASGDVQFNDVDLMLFDKLIAFDNYKQKIILIVNIDAAAADTEYEKCVKELKNLKNLIVSRKRSKAPFSKIKSDFRSLFSKDEFCSMVEKAKWHIKEGNIFQAVLSNRFEADFEGSLFDTYRVLRAANPSPYMFYFSGNDLEIAGASPETLVKLHDGRLSTFPLAGTRPRGMTDSEDAALEKELLSNEKELAEHNMLVDLGRNDLGKISKFGTVNVEKYMEILRFSHVMHIGSTVSGEILDNKTGLDAINAVLPAGTLSGAPKIRAMQIINELEQNKRGIYGGAIGYLDFTGNMDTCIAIRIAYKKDRKVFVRAGAGIVADSDPEAEYQECLNKAKVVINALKSSNGGLFT